MATSQLHLNATREQSVPLNIQVDKMSWPVDISRHLFLITPGTPVLAQWIMNEVTTLTESKLSIDPTAGVSSHKAVVYVSPVSRMYGFKNLGVEVEWPCSWSLSETHLGNFCFLSPNFRLCGSKQGSAAQSQCTKSYPQPVFS